MTTESSTPSAPNGSTASATSAMSTVSTTSAASMDSPASLYGPVSVGFGVLALVTSLFAGVLAILFGVLAVTFAALGLGRRLNRGKCAIGLVTGAIGALYPLFAIVALST
ncbi:hypothetical protein SGFS_061460 [Streptomyces graminofaciens]|uniref:DUF4190 domain-containing protein n=1 Tax=Streptomyces graminofaciens TaxID=68212 RepID=A0ABM8HLM0_9ACTN|nr:hypothetical protein [Streptomyces graminofaciens]BBC34852.1 hypothetical protein SGFS_061460 [Streptomyces graminofaciens]